MKKPTIRKLIKRLDVVFSIYIRKKYADEKGMVRCFTCSKLIPWQESQNSHYCSRRHMNTRFEEKNCAPACFACNVFKHGALDDYALALQRKCGDGILKELNRLKNQTKKWTAQELLSLIEKYTKLAT